MMRMYPRALLVLLAVYSFSCAAQESRIIELPDDLPGEVIAFPDLLIVRDFIKSGKEYFALDHQAGKVFVYSEDGELLRSFGEPGSGPGELTSPRHLAADDARLFVVEMTGAAHEFSKMGDYQRSIKDDRIIALNGNTHVVDEGRLFIGGLRETEEGDTFAHILSLDDRKLIDFFPLTPLGESFGVQSVNASQCDIDEDLSLWCVQPAEYVIARFDLDGNSMGDLAVDSPVFRPLNSPHPGSEDLQRMVEWSSTWDKLWSVHVVDEGRLLIEIISPGSRPRWELIDKSTGHATVIFTGAKLITFFDKEEGAIYLQEPPVEELVTHIRKILLDDLLALG